MQEHATRAHRLEIPVPPYTSGPKLNGDPAIMWEAVSREGNFLGELNPSDRIVWFGMFPTGQYVPEPVPGQDNDYAHFMISPREVQFMGQPSTKGRESFLTPENLEEEDLETAARFLLDFSQYPNTVFGYNIGSDPELIKPSSQTWRNFHIQCMKLPAELISLRYVPRALREPGYKTMEGYLALSIAGELQDQDGLEDASVVDPQTVQSLGFRPNGCAVIDLGYNVAPQRLSKVIKGIHDAYGRVHEGWGRTFFDNYDAVRDSGWVDTYRLRPKEQVMTDLSDGLTDSDMAFFSDYYDQALPRLLADREERLRTVQSVVHGEPVPPIPASDRVPFEGPTYSASFVNRNGQMHAILMPHILRRSGSAEALGIEIKRVLVPDPSDVSYSCRKANAQRYFEEVAHSSMVSNRPQ